MEHLRISSLNDPGPYYEKMFVYNLLKSEIRKEDISHICNYIWDFRLWFLLDTPNIKYFIKILKECKRFLSLFYIC